MIAIAINLAEWEQQAMNCPLQLEVVVMNARINNIINIMNAQLIVDQLSKDPFNPWGLVAAIELRLILKEDYKTLFETLKILPTLNDGEEWERYNAELEAIDLFRKYSQLETEENKSVSVSYHQEVSDITVWYRMGCPSFEEDFIPF